MTQSINTQQQEVSPGKKEERGKVSGEAPLDQLVYTFAASKILPYFTLVVVHLETLYSKVAEHLINSWIGFASSSRDFRCHEIFESLETPATISLAGLNPAPSTRPYSASSWCRCPCGAPLGRAARSSPPPRTMEYYFIFASSGLSVHRCWYHAGSMVTSTLTFLVPLVPCSGPLRISDLANNHTPIVSSELCTVSARETVKIMKTSSMTITFVISKRGQKRQ